MGCKTFINLVSSWLSEMIIAFYLVDVYTASQICRDLVIGTQGDGLHCWFNWSVKAILTPDFVISADFSKRKFCCGPCLVWQCSADSCSAMEPVCFAFVTSLHCLLLFQLWMNPPLTMVSKGYRRLSPGTPVTLNACQRSASSLLFY